MEKNVIIPELFKDSDVRFLKHLEIEGNERIIFSGKFGHGKTTFLREFFSDERQQKNFRDKKYNIISIFPVNYSIASNEDIFKYIKYDIILEMLGKGYEVNEVLIDQFKLIPQFLRKKEVQIIRILLSMIPKVGSTSADIFDRCIKLAKEFAEYHKAAEEEANKTNVLIDFFDTLEEQEGSIYENNIVSKTIEELLKQKKVGNDEVENVLIIDDLDRIDPEHIFRILNVFAAHFDRRNILNAKNKFGFDKVIIVCDIENVRNIFKAKFGVDTDFNGYIDKFYTYEVFNYSLFDLKIVAQAFLMDQSDWTLYTSNHHFSEHYKQQFFYKNAFFIDMLTELINADQVDLRNVLKWKNLKVPTRNTRVHNSVMYFDEERNPIILHFRLLAILKGDADGLKDAFNNIKVCLLDTAKIHEYISSMLWITNVLNHKLNKDTANINCRVKDYPIVFRVDGNGASRIIHRDSQPLIFDVSHLIYQIHSTIDFLVTNKVL